ncbi:MAG: CAP domain-containing protein [Alteraurantiacibacter sp.]
MGPTNEEQLILELINRLRMDPGGEAARLTDPAVLSEIRSALDFFGVDMDSFATAMDAFAALAPLAWNEALHVAASGHNDEMIATDTQSHRLPGEAGLGDRVTAAGYENWRSLGENVYAFSRSAIYGHAGFVIDWGYDVDDFDASGVRYADWQSRGDGIQDPAGHLLNLMNAAYTEIGVAVTEETDSSTSVGPYVTTHNLGTRFGYEAQFVGVVIDDADGDDFYDVGEGMGGITVTLTSVSGTYTTTTWGSGGWQIAVPSGAYTIAFTGGALSGAIEVQAALGSDNTKVDVQSDMAIVAGGRLNGTDQADSLEGSQNVDEIYGFGGDDLIYAYAGNDFVDGGRGLDTIYGGDGSDEILGGSGKDILHGDEGDDTILGEGLSDEIYGGAGNDNLQGGNGWDTVVGGAGNDFLKGQRGHDTLVGSEGNDDLRGNDGRDILIGGADQDTMTGGTGSDIFRFLQGDNAGFEGHNADRITDFSRGDGDQIDIGALVTELFSHGGQSFAFIGRDGFIGHTLNENGQIGLGQGVGEVRYEFFDNSYTMVQIDFNGDAQADFAFRVDGTLNLIESDFIFSFA